jgi:hypothetical protein
MSTDRPEAVRDGRKPWGALSSLAWQCGFAAVAKASRPRLDRREHSPCESRVASTTPEVGLKAARQVELVLERWAPTRTRAAREPGSLTSMLRVVGAVFGIEELERIGP